MLLRSILPPSLNFLLLSTLSVTTAELSSREGEVKETIDFAKTCNSLRNSCESKNIDFWKDELYDPKCNITATADLDYVVAVSESVMPADKRDLCGLHINLRSWDSSTPAMRGMPVSLTITGHCKDCKGRDIMISKRASEQLLWGEIPTPRVIAGYWYIEDLPHDYPTSVPKNS